MLGSKLGEVTVVVRVEEHRGYRLDSDTVQLGGDPDRLHRRSAAGVVGQCVSGHRHHTEARTAQDAFGHILAECVAGVPLREASHDVTAAQDVQRGDVGRVEFEAANVETIGDVLVGPTQFGDHLGV